MAYRTEFAPSAEREFRKLPQPVRVELARAIDALSENPRPGGVEKLAQIKGCYRIRQGDYRVIYVVYEARVVILVVRIGSRGEVYKRLSRLKKIIGRWEANQR